MHWSQIRLLVGPIAGRKLPRTGLLLTRLVLSGLPLSGLLLSGLAISGLAISGLATLGVSTVQAQVHGRAYQPEFAPDVSRGFRMRIQHAISKIPSSVWVRMHKDKVRLVVPRFLVDVEPGLRNVRPRGWSEGSTWANSDAAFFAQTKTLVVAEKYLTRAGREAKSGRVVSVTRHELGHAFDLVTGRTALPLSASGEYRDVYYKDVAHVKSRNREPLSYFMPGNSGGGEEAFAEAFAIAVGGTESSHDDRRFKESFPRVCYFVRQAIHAYGAPQVLKRNQRKRVLQPPGG